jgi:hypothetical protein
MGSSASTCLGGNSADPILDNVWSKDKNKNNILVHLFDDAIEKFFTKYFTIGKFKDKDAWLDFTIIEDEQILMGQEPAYFGEDLKLVCLHKIKELSYFQTGHAFGYWGTGIRSKVKTYSSYKYNSKFKKFIDKWHPKIYEKNI